MDTAIEEFFVKKNLENFSKLTLNPITFRLGLAKDLPLAALIGAKITVLNEEECEAAVPYKFLNKNPFNTTYWAVMGMVAEMASGAILLMYTNKLKPSVSTFVIGCDAKFIKTATGLTTFKCNQGKEIAQKVFNTCQNFEPQDIKCATPAYNEKGELIAEFSFTWGIKARKPK